MDFDPKEPTTFSYKNGEPPQLAETHEGAIKRTGRWRGFRVYGRRCRWCKRGILWIQNDEQREGRKRRNQVAIEPKTWEGEEWYWKGKHRWHGLECEGMRKARTIEGKYIGRKRDRKNLEFVV